MANTSFLIISLLYLVTRHATDATFYIEAGQIGCRYYRSICQRNEYCSYVDPRGVCLSVNAQRRSYDEELLKPIINQRSNSYEVYVKNPALYQSQLSLRASYQNLLWKWYLAQHLKQKGWQGYENIKYNEENSMNTNINGHNNVGQPSQYLPQQSYEVVPEGMDWYNNPGGDDDDESDQGAIPPESSDTDNQQESPQVNQQTDNQSTKPTLASSVQPQTTSSATTAAGTTVKVNSTLSTSPSTHESNSAQSKEVINIKIKSGIDAKIVEDNLASLENYLHLRHGTFTNLRINGDMVSFNVNPNIRNVTASIVLDAIYNGNSPFKEIMAHTTEMPIDDEDNNELQITLLIWIMVAVLVITALVSLFVFVFKKGKSDNKEDMVGLLASESDVADYEELCRQRAASKKSDMASGKVITIGDAEQVTESLDSVASSWSQEPVMADMDISTGHVVLSYMEDHLKNKDRLMKEWEALVKYKVDRSSGLVASRAVNIRLNRYNDTFPYDHNRVVLTTSPSTDVDYINASYIYDHNPRNPMYIATQGPIPNTKSHFWQMIWEQKIATIVMLTRLKENEVAVCALYWPEKKGKECYGDYEVTLVSEHNWCDDYVVRNFYLRNVKNQETRTVTQFQYLSWPDMGMPKDTAAFLEFRRKVNRSYHGQGCPVVVHCNDGAGRTGTYILIDMTLKRLSKGTKEIDIAATIEHLRDQRIGMVKTKVQFEFSLSSIAEEVNEILNALK